MWRLAWSHQPRHSTMAVKVGANGLFVAHVDTDAALSVFGRDGGVLWRFASRSTGKTHSMRWVDASRDGSLLVAGGYWSGRKAYALDAAGNELWDRSLRSSYVIARLSEDGSRVCISDGDSVSLYARDGGPVWSKTLGDIVLQLETNRDLSLIAARKNKGELEVLDRDGRTIWQRGPGESALPLEVTPDGALVLAGVKRNTLGAFDRDGNQLWRHASPGTIHPVAHDRDGTIIALGSDDGELVALDREGSVLWTHSDREHRLHYADRSWVFPVVVATDGSLVTGVWEDRFLRAFDRDGNLLWEHEGGDDISTGGDESYDLAVAGDGSSIAAALNDGNFLIFDREGERSLKLEAGPYIVGPSMSEDGTLVAASLDEHALAVFDRG